MAYVRPEITDHGDLRGRTPQCVGACDGLRRIERGRHHGACPTKRAVARHYDIGALWQRPLQREEGLAAHHHRLADRQRPEALHVASEPPGDRTTSADHAKGITDFDSRAFRVKDLLEDTGIACGDFLFKYRNIPCFAIHIHQQVQQFLIIRQRPA